MSHRIVCIGECMVEMAPQATAGDYRMGFAGDTMNTAWYLRQLMSADDTVNYLTAVGVDATSDAMLRFLADAGIGTDHVARRADQTVGLYLIQLTDGERSFAYWRGQSAARTLAQDEDALDAALNGAQMAYLSGITLAILSAPDRTRLLNRLAAFRAKGGQVVFDPNLRPRLWDTIDDMTHAVMQAAAVSDVVLPSHEDEAEFFGDTDPAATAQRYANAGASEVVVKNGDGPMLTLCDGQTTVAHPKAVPHVVDTTAAGDSFNAGYLAYRLHGGSVSDAMAQAASLAARVIQNRGALMTVSDADELFPDQVTRA